VAKTQATIGIIAYLSMILFESRGRRDPREPIEALDILAIYWRPRWVPPAADALLARRACFESTNAIAKTTMGRRYGGGYNPSFAINQTRRHSLLDEIAIWFEWHDVGGCEVVLWRVIVSATPYALAPRRSHFRLIELVGFQSVTTLADVSLQPSESGVGLPRIIPRGGTGPYRYKCYLQATLRSRSVRIKCGRLRSYARSATEVGLAPAQHVRSSTNGCAGPIRSSRLREWRPGVVARLRRQRGKLG
jgi:hypothetical protein